MTAIILRSLLLITLSVAWCLPTKAQEASEAPPAEPKTADKALDIATLIQQLDADDFNERQTASGKLAAAGESAVPALEKAAASDSRETSMRAFDILKGHIDKGTPTLKDVARQALERISKGDSGSASRRATEALAPPNADDPNVPRNARAFPFAPAPGGIRIAGARVVIAAGAAGGGVETKIKVENGVKTTEVKDKERQVKIVDDPDKGLQMEVTETKDGKETTQKYEAKNAEELKTKNAEAHKLYEQYSQKGAEIKIGGFGLVPMVVPLPIAPVPAIAPARLAPRLPVAPIEPAAPAKKVENFDALEKAIQEAEASLKESLKQSGDSEQLKQAQQRLEEVRKQLEKLRASQK